MASGINQFMFDGNLTKAVELRSTPDGTPMAVYTVASDYVRAGKELTDFFPVATFGRQAEADAKYLKRGSAVTVVCEVHSWYKADEKKGGYNFDVVRVIYRSDPRSASSNTSNVERPQAQEDDWVKGYDREEQRQQQGPRSSTRA